MRIWLSLPMFRAMMEGGQAHESIGVQGAQRLTIVDHEAVQNRWAAMLQSKAPTVPLH